MRAAPALALAAIALVAAGCASDDPEPSSAAERPRSEETGAPADSSSEESSSESPAESVTVPAYFVGDTPQGPRLFREFQKVEATDPLDAAAALVTSGNALDPDYRTLFPAGAVDDVSRDGGVFVVEMADGSWATRAPGMSAADAKLAVQQLVHTLQGVAQTRDPVTFRVGGQPSTIFGIDSADGIGNAKPLTVLGLVNVTAPEQGSSADGSLTASGVASSFEATVPWQIRQGDDVVQDGFATAEGWIDKLYPWETQIDISGLAPGEYTFVAMTDDPSGGEGGGPTEDSKTFTVG
jgi:hypothetical protein